MTATIPNLKAGLKITWPLLPDDYVLPDDPVENAVQPLLPQEQAQEAETKAQEAEAKAQAARAEAECERREKEALLAKLRAAGLD